MLEREIGWLMRGVGTEVDGGIGVGDCEGSLCVDLVWGGGGIWYQGSSKGVVDVREEILDVLGEKE